MENKNIFIEFELPLNIVSEMCPKNTPVWCSLYGVDLKAYAV